MAIFVGRTSALVRTLLCQLGSLHWCRRWKPDVISSFFFSSLIPIISILTSFSFSWFLTSQNQPLTTHHGSLVIWVFSRTQIKSSIYRISILRLYLLILQQNLRFPLERSLWFKIPLHTSIPISSKIHWIFNPRPLNFRPSPHFPQIFPTSITTHFRMADIRPPRRLLPRSQIWPLPCQQLQMTW